MKMIYCTCNVSVLEELTEIVETCHIRDYQAFDHVIAKNKKGDPRLDTPVWPGYNAAVMMQVAEEEKVKTFLQAIRERNKTVLNNDELVTVCTWNLETYFYD